MPLTTSCAGCQAKYSLPDNLGGKKVRCKKCGQTFVVPAAAVNTSAKVPLETLPQRPRVTEAKAQKSEPEPVVRAARKRPAPEKSSEKAAPNPTVKVAAILGAAAFVLIGLVVAGGFIAVKAWHTLKKGRGGEPVPSLAQIVDAPIAFPPLPPATEIEPGILFHEVSLPRPGKPPAKVFIYLPKERSGKIPLVLVAPAGSTLFVGMDLGSGDRAEQIPYARAGFAVVAYSIDGQVNDVEKASDATIKVGARAFQEAGAGLVNARQALGFALAKVPDLDPAKVFTAGHSSAATLSLLVAQHDSRVRGCIAYAPVTDVVQHLQPAMTTLTALIPSFTEFIADSSPKTHVAKLKCPVFLFHAQDDSNVPIAQTAAFIEEVKRTNSNVTFVRAASGDHYDSMIREGIPQGIEWLRKLSVSAGPEPAPVDGAKATLTDSHPQTSSPKSGASTENLSPATRVLETPLDPNEEFVDLPGDAPKENPSASISPDEHSKIVLTNGRARRVPGAMAFAVDYQFVEGVSHPERFRYFWVIRTARNWAYKQELRGTSQLKAKGTLEGMARGTAVVQGPFECYLEIQRQDAVGPRGEGMKVSDVVPLK